MKSLNNRRRGFSLIELLIVIAIILIIITVAVPKFQKAQMFARDMGAQKALQTIHQVEVQYQSQYGRYANSPLKSWFDHLASGKGLCCSMADGETVADPDWESKGGHYRVRLDDNWIDVPDDAVITEPNRAGPTMVWPTYLDGHPQVRCFMPGTMG